MKKILIIEDDPDIRNMLQYALSRESFHVLTASDGQEGLDLALSSDPDLIILDLMLPKLSGIEVCKKVRTQPQTQNTPVIMLTAKGDETDIVFGLGIGADDYVKKPFSVKELSARVYARLRMQSPTPPPQSADDKFYYAGVEIDTQRFEVKINADPLPLTLAEFRLFKSLAVRPGIVQTRERLLDVITGGESVVIDRNIDVHIRSIRKKLGEHRDLIQTVRGVGYRFKEC